MEIYWCASGVSSSEPLFKHTAEAYLLLARQLAPSSLKGILLPIGDRSPDPWMIASLMATSAPQIVPIVACYPDAVSLAELSRRINTFTSLFGSQIAINMVVGSSNAPKAPLSKTKWPHHARYNSAASYFRDVIDHYTKNYIRQPPTLISAGSSIESFRFASLLADHHLFLGFPPHQIKRQIDQINQIRSANRQVMRFGVRLHLLIRETSEAAWDSAKVLFGRVTPATLKSRLDDLAETDSVGGSEMALMCGVSAKIPTDIRALEIHPNLWGGPAFLRRGPGTAIVGTKENLCSIMKEYVSAGVSIFIFSQVEGGYSLPSIISILAREI